MSESSSAAKPPPRPVRPSPARGDAPVRNGSGCLPIVLAFALLLVLGAVMMVLSLGYLLPFLVLFGGLMLLIFGQYLLWGWYFERIYRSGRENTLEPMEPIDDMPAKLDE